MLKDVCSQLNFSFTFPGSSNQIFELDTFEYSFIQHLVFHHCGEYKTYVVKCVSNIFIDIQMSIICCVPQKIKRSEGYKQGKREEAKTASKKKQDWNTKKKDWTDDEVSLLIGRFKTNLCLWDMYRTDYTNRSIKEIVYTEIATSLDTNIPSIKSKINGRKMAKEKSSKSGQSTDELYSSNWIHYDKLAFLVPVIGASKISDTLKKINF